MTLATETIKLWRNNAKITAGETAEDDPEHIAAKAILALTAEILANREAQPVGYIDPDSLKEYRGQRAGGTWSAVQRTTSGLNMTTPIYTAPPAPAVPDGYCVMPLTLTAANGAKGALSGEFKVSRTVRCHECGGEGCDDCADAGEFEEEITVPWDTIKDIYRAAVDACRAAMLNHVGETNEKADAKCECSSIDYCENCLRAMLAQPVSSGYTLVPVEPTENMIIDGFESDAFMALADAVNEKNSWPYGCRESAECVEGIFKAMLAAAPGGGNG